MRIWDQNDRILMKNFNPLSLIQNLNVTAKHTYNATPHV